MDLILLVVGLPNVKGFQFCREIRGPSGSERLFCHCRIMSPWPDPTAFAKSVAFPLYRLQKDLQRELLLKNT